MRLVTLVPCINVAACSPASTTEAHRNFWRQGSGFKKVFANQRPEDSNQTSTKLQPDFSTHRLTATQNEPEVLQVLHLPRKTSRRCSKCCEIEVTANTAQPHIPNTWEPSTRHPGTKVSFSCILLHLILVFLVEDSVALLCPAICIARSNHHTAKPAKARQKWRPVCEIAAQQFVNKSSKVGFSTRS